MPEAALSVFEEMEASGVEVDAAACSALFNAFNKCGQPEMTLVLWSKSKRYVEFGVPAYMQLLRACSM
jgi:hypothetical protein